MDIRISASTDNLFNGGDVCVHLAANTGVPASVADPHGVLQTFKVPECIRGMQTSKRSPINFHLFKCSFGAANSSTAKTWRLVLSHRMERLAGREGCAQHNSCFGVETVVYVSEMYMDRVPQTKHQ